MLLALVACSGCFSASFRDESFVFTGEWMIHDGGPSGAARRAPAMYLHLQQAGETLSGSAVDSNLVEGVVSGSVVSGRVEWVVSFPQGAGPFDPPCKLAYEGVAVSRRVVTGGYVRAGVSAAGSAWSGRRTADGTNRTMHIAPEFPVDLALNERQAAFVNSRFWPEADYGYPDFSQVGTREVVVVLPAKELFVMLRDQRQRVIEALGVEMAADFRRRLATALMSRGVPPAWLAGLSRKDS